MILERLPARSRFGKGRLDQACVMRALAGARNVRPALLMLGAAGCIHARLPARSRFGKGRLDQACVMLALA